MKSRIRPLFAWIGVLIAAGGVFLFSKTVPVVSLGNPHQGRILFFKIRSSEPITLCYTNSIYNAPVQEVFEVREGNFTLKAVKSPSPAVMEYYGFEEAGPLQTMNRKVGPVFSIQTSLRQDQSLRIGDTAVDLHAVVKRGERIEIRVEDIPFASFLLSSWFRHADTDAPIKNP